MAFRAFTQRWRPQPQDWVAEAADEAQPCLCPACAGGGEPEFFIPPSSGLAENGKPVFSWDEAAAQITRSGNSWSPALGQGAVVTYGFRATAPGSMPSGTGGFSPFTEEQIIATETVLRLWADVANILFVRVGQGSAGPGAYSNDASMLFANYATGMEDASAFAYLPSPGSTGAGQLAGDVWVNSSLANNQDLTPGSFGPHILAHEIGHAIGLRHPSDYDGGSPTYAANAAYWQDARMFTVMSYFGSSNVGGSLNAFAAGPQLHDIAAAQRLYGPNLTTRTGDTVYGFNSNTGLAHFTIAAATQSAVFSIWDAGGVDTLDLSGYTTPSEIDLRPEAFSGSGPGNGGVGVAVGNISIARGVVIENAVGGAGDDLIIGNDAANRLTGRGGADTINGGAGLDTAAYTHTIANTSFSRTASGDWRISTGPDGSDTLSGVEFAAFLDRTVAFRPAEGSIDGNGTSDLVLRSATGAVAVWTVSGLSVAGAAVIGVGDVTYAAVGQGDFNGDGVYDLLFRQAGGLLAQWQLTPSGVGGVSVYGADPAWTIAAIGDFDGDFKDDLLWRSSSGVLAQWRMDGLQVAGAAVFATSDPAWTLVAAVDFNGDGKDDVLWRNASGALAHWTMDGLAVSAAGVFALSDPDWQIVGTGDFNGDLREDILWRSAGGVMALWTMDGPTVLSAGVLAVSDPAWAVSDVGDYDADGRDDILWQGPDGTFAVWTMSGFSILSTGILGNPGAGWTDIA